LRGNLALIAAALEVLGEGVRIAESAGDFVSRTLFAEMLADEEAHTDWLETQLDLVERIGLGAYLQTQIHA
jgi:bacterioferritin